MGKPEHAMRATNTQSLLRSARKLSGSERTDVLNALGESGIDEIESAIAVAWLPMSLHMRLADAIRDRIGAERNVRLWCETMNETYNQILLRGFISASVDLFGMTPASLFRQSPYIYRHLTHGLGSLTFVPEADGATVTLRDFPAEKFRFVCYAEGMVGCLESSIARGRGKGTVTMSDLDEARGSIVYRCVWSLPGATG